MFRCSKTASQDWLHAILHDQPSGAQTEVGLGVHSCIDCIGPVGSADSVTDMAVLGMRPMSQRVEIEVRAHLQHDVPKILVGGKCPAMPVTK